MVMAAGFAQILPHHLEAAVPLTEADQVAREDMRYGQQSVVAQEAMEEQGTYWALRRTKMTHVLAESPAEVVVETSRMAPVADQAELVADQVELVAELT
mmetsp:Transcript_48962/g.109797  ORF Transcript_48962/g.109797 Transcript_48962/m.109797 type:complete len:99 (-) Transcript_48962:212-508(-)